MPMTRDFFVVCVGFLLVCIISAFFLVSDTPQQSTSIDTEKTITFSEPKETYGLAPAEKDTTERDRKVFIEKVRKEHIPAHTTTQNKVQDETKIISGVQEDIRATSTPYGNSGI